MALIFRIGLLRVKSSMILGALRNNVGNYSSLNSAVPSILNPMPLGAA